MVANSITITPATRSDYEFILTHMKADDGRKVAWEEKNFKTSSEYYIDLWESYEHTYTARLNGKILFSAGVKHLPGVEGLSLFWMPTIHAETYKKSYGRASYMMMDKLREFGEPIWTMFPDWYNKNKFASEHLGFRYVDTVELKGQKFLLCRTEV